LGDDEEMWTDRDAYAKRAMAQTRAMSRAGRSAFAYVVVLMGNDLSTTPAEEVPEGGFKNDRPNCPTCGVKLYKKKEDGSFFCWKNKEKKKNGCGAVFTADFQTKGKDTSEKVNKFNKFWEQISTKQRDHMASMTLEDKYTFFNEHKWDIEKVKEVLAEEMELDKVSKETVPDAVFGKDSDIPI